MTTKIEHIGVDSTLTACVFDHKHKHFTAVAVSEEGSGFPLTMYLKMKFIDRCKVIVGHSRTIREGKYIKEFRWEPRK